MVARDVKLVISMATEDIKQLETSMATEDIKHGIMFMVAQDVKLVLSLVSENIRLVIFMAGDRGHIKQGMFMVA